MLCQKERFKEYDYIFVIFFRRVQGSKFEVEYWLREVQNEKRTDKLYFIISLN